MGFMAAGHYSAPAARPECNGRTSGNSTSGPWRATGGEAQSAPPIRYAAALPELPDVTLYVEHLTRRLVGRRIERTRILGLNLLRTFDPSPDDVAGVPVREIRRLGKRIVVAFDGDLFLVIHLMIAGRLHWKERGATPPRKVALAAFDFADGTLTLTEAGTKKRAGLWVVRGEESLHALDPGGIEPLSATVKAFRAALTREN